MNNNDKIGKLINRLLKEQSFPWDYYYLKNGKIVDKNGHSVFNNTPLFKTIEKAEQWLENNNERGNVIGDFEDFKKNKK